MTAMDMNAPAPQYAAGMVAELDTTLPDDLAARRARLAEAICQTFFCQLKLINAMMIELPLGWFAARAERETMPDEPAELCETTTIEFIAATTIELAPASIPAQAEPLVSEDAPVEPLLSEPAPVQEIEAAEMLPAKHKPRKGKTSRLKPTA